MTGPGEVLGRWSWLEQRATWTALAPGLAVGMRTDFSNTPNQSPIPLHPRLGASGFTRMPGLLAGSVPHMRRAMEAVEAAGLPAVFAYMYDALWEPLDGLHALGSAELGDDYDVLSDVWAFRIPPGRQGWAPHRGRSEDEGLCTLNVWISISDARKDTACMFVVPLSEDPAYPTRLSSMTVPDRTAVALETEPGDVLVWNANVLHWGGPIRVDAPGPRLSSTFTLRRRDRRLPELPVLRRASLDLRARLDVIAGEIAKYGELGGVPEELRHWAQLTLLTRTMGARLLDA